MHAFDWLEVPSNQTHLEKLGLKCNAVVTLDIVQRGTTWHNITTTCGITWHNVTQHNITCQVAVDCTFSPQNVALNVGIRNVAQCHGQNMTL